MKACLVTLGLVCGCAPAPSSLAGRYELTATSWEGFWDEGGHDGEPAPEGTEREAWMRLPASIELVFAREECAWAPGYRVRAAAVVPELRCAAWRVRRDGRLELTWTDGYGESIHVLLAPVAQGRWRGRARTYVDMVPNISFRCDVDLVRRP